MTQVNFETVFTHVCLDKTVFNQVNSFFGLSGAELTAADAFTIFSIFTALQFTVGTLPYALKSIAEGKVKYVNHVVYFVKHFNTFYLSS